MPICTPGAPQRRSEELSRPQSGQPTRENMPDVRQRTSFDTAHPQKNRRSGQQFMSSFPELLPLDLPVSKATPPKSSSTPASTHRQLPNNFPSGYQPSGGSLHNPLVKLDEMMFPSNDPFAYPNQPLVDFSQQPHGTPSGQPGSSHQDSMPFYMPNVYDGIEGQLLGPIPPYLMQPEQGQQGLDLSSQMYNASNMLTLQQIQLNPYGAMNTQQCQGSEMQEIMADPQFKGDWGNLFPSNYRPQ